eukprot:gene34175-45831_t
MTMMEGCPPKYVMVRNEPQASVSNHATPCWTLTARLGSVMAAINSVTELTQDGDIAIVTLNSPPVNALSANVRDGLFEGFKAAIADDSVKAIVLICEGRTFIAGADISEFGAAAGVPTASLFDVQDMMENSKVPVVAAIHGTALGGGLSPVLLDTLQDWLALHDQLPVVRALDGSGGTGHGGEVPHDTLAVMSADGRRVAVVGRPYP